MPEASESRKTEALDDDATPCCGCCGCCKPKNLLANYALTHELRRLHTARKTAFDPETAAHERLLRDAAFPLASEPAAIATEPMVRSEEDR